MALATPTLPIVALSRRVRTQRVADVLVDQLIKAGVDTVFGLPGGTIAPLNDALLDRPEVRVVTSRHESGAMFAAAGYARATGKVGVVMVTSGPGALNAFTGLASAYCDNLPILLIAGEVPRKLFGKGALQEGSSGHLNIVGMAKHITKFAKEMTHAGAAPALMKRALTSCASGCPGPALLTIPLDVSTAMISRPGIASNVNVSTSLSDDLLRKVACTLSEARRPAIFAGSGVRWGRGAVRLRELAERLQVPVMTSLKGKGVFPESHPLSLGVFGYGGHPSCSDYLEDGVDVMLAVGTSLSDPATNGWSPLLEPCEHFIQIDIDAAQMGRNYDVSVGLVGPAESVLGQLSRYVSPKPRGVRNFGIRHHTDPQKIKTGKHGLISPQRALWELQRSLPSETLFTCDIGEHLLFAAHYLQTDRPDGFITMTGLASMGSSIAAAVGTKLARWREPVAAVVGDGGFAMAASDVAMAARERVPIVIAVLNDRRYGMVESGNSAVYGRTPDYTLDEMDVANIARSMGAQAFVVDSPDALLQLDWDQFASDRPIVIDIRIDPSITMPRNKRFELLKKEASK